MIVLTTSVSVLSPNCNQMNDIHFYLLENEGLYLKISYEVCLYSDSMFFIFNRLCIPLGLDASKPFYTSLLFCTFGH